MFLRKLSMKKCVQYFAIIFTIILLFCSFATTAFAKDLEPCYHCSGTGEFHCHICDNNGETVCDTCGGAGKWACPGEEGKGKCNNGWIVCPSCNGDGKIGDGPCGNCADSGKPGYIRCVVCHGSGEVICPGCSGNGKCECQVGDCQKARTVGYKCPYCMGAGYLLVNFSPGENNGVDNRPANGDQIWVNGTYTIYGGSSGGNNSQSENNQSSGGKQTETSPPASSDTQPQTGTQTTNFKPSINETPSSEITVQLPGNRTSDFTLAPNQDGDKTTKVSAAVEIAQH